MAAKKPLVTGASPAVVRQIDNDDHLDVPGGVDLGIPLGRSSGGLGVDASGWAAGSVPLLQDSFFGPVFEAFPFPFTPVDPGANNQIGYTDNNGGWSFSSSFRYDPTAKSILIDGGTINVTTQPYYRAISMSCNDPSGTWGGGISLLYFASSGQCTIDLGGGAVFSLHSLGDMSWKGNVVWHAGNDGVGSGLDSDLLDGQQGTYYLTRNNHTGVTPVAGGGTGQTTLALSRNAMGLGNTTGALPVANGGTGAANAANARTNLGLGTAATRNAPASGNASATEVVLGNDTRLGGPPTDVHSIVTDGGATYEDFTWTGEATTAVLVITSSGQSGSRSIGGLAITRWAGRRIVLVNKTGSVVTLMHFSTGSTTANRFLFVGNTNYSLGPHGAVELVWDSVTGRYWIRVD